MSGIPYYYLSHVDIDGLFAHLMVGRGARAFNQIVRKAIKEVLVNHHANTMPHHFNVDRQKRYSYKPRRPEYNRQKAKQFYRFNVGRVADLVRTGTLRRFILAFLQTTMKGTMAKGEGVTGALVWNMPFPARDLANTGVKYDDMVDEITMILPSEAEDMAAMFMDKFMQAAITYELRKSRLNYSARHVSQLQSAIGTPNTFLDL